MDASILQLYSTEEILKRLTEKTATGGLHVFTSRESANIFFENGTIVAASKGSMQGEEVLQLILDWPEAKLTWQEGVPPAAGLKQVALKFPDFLSNSQPTMKPVLNGKKPGELKAAQPPDTKSMLAMGSSTAATGPMTLTPRARVKTSTENEEALASMSSSTSLVPVTGLSVTKHVTRGLEVDPYEEALMRKHQLMLVSIGDTPPQRLRIIRSTNLVGRNPACDFTLNHSSISRQHCLLQIMDRGLHVKDLSSSNGTKVNGINLTEGYVSVGDKLTIGRLDFRVEKDELPA